MTGSNDYVHLLGHSDRTPSCHSERSEESRPEGDPPYRVAVDAMGGDFAPAEIVEGALLGARLHNIHVILVGDPPSLRSELERLQVSPDSVPLAPSQGSITEGEHPARALRKNPRASVAVATGLVKAGKADAMVSLGSTGGAMASAALGLGLLPGVERPCVGGPFISLAPHTAILDVGSNIDCRPQQLLSFAVMGCVFVRKFLGIPNPTVGLLSVGQEEGKGNRQVQEAYPIFKESGLNFVGNVEGSDILADKTNVVVCDGFVGNVLLKFAESLGGSAASFLQDKLRGKLPDEDLRRLSQSLYDLTNRSRKTSGPLFGVNGNVIVGHGASRSREVAGAIETAKRCIQLDMANSIRQELTQFEEFIGARQNGP